MKITACFLVIFIISFSLQAQVAAGGKKEKAATKSVASITGLPAVSSGDVLVLKEMEYDFGEIPQGKPVTHIFDVLNNGNDSLKIIGVVASCGCTTPDWDKNKVQAPAEKTAITVGYNAAMEGAFNKTITITYNGDKTKQITIKGNVWKTPATSAPENTVIANLKD